MRYPNSIVHTRTSATLLSAAFVAAQVPLLIMHWDPVRFGLTSTKIMLAIMPLVVTYRCFRFLKQEETKRERPTPEMSFIFGLAVSLTVAIGVVGLIVVGG